MQINFHSRLCSYLPRVPKYLAMTAYIINKVNLSAANRIIKTASFHENVQFFLWNQYYTLNWTVTLSSYRCILCLSVWEYWLVVLQTHLIDDFVICTNLSKRMGFHSFLVRCSLMVQFYVIGVHPSIPTFIHTQRNFRRHKLPSCSIITSSSENIWPQKASLRPAHCHQSIPECLRVWSPSNGKSQHEFTLFWEKQIQIGTN